MAPTSYEVRQQGFLPEGRQKTVADAISWLPTWGYTATEPDLKIPCFTVFLVETPIPLAVIKEVDSSSWEKLD